jgi:hypothetical protein
MRSFEILKTFFAGKIDRDGLGLDSQEKLVEYLCYIYPDNFLPTKPSPVRQDSVRARVNATPLPGISSGTPLRQPPITPPIRQRTASPKKVDSPFKQPTITPDIETPPIRQLSPPKKLDSPFKQPSPPPPGRQETPIKTPVASPIRARAIPPPFMTSGTPVEPFPTTPPLEQDTDSEIDSDEDVERRLSRLTSDKPVPITKLTELQDSVVKCLMEL